MWFLRRTGEWDKDANCSRCGERDLRKTRYCPNCGARMKVKARKMPKDVDPVKFGEKICNDFRNGIPLIVEGVKGKDNE